MASAAASPRGDAGPGWIATTLGVLVLVAGGFLAGLLVGVVSQEPELVAGHLAGRSEVVDWSPPPLEQLDELGGELPSVSSGVEAAFPEAEAVREDRIRDYASLPSVPERVLDESFSERPAVASAPPPAPMIQSGSFAVQVGAFGEGAAAESLATSLKRKGFPAYVTPSAGESAQRWRVRVGPVETRAEADTIARRLKVDEQLPTWVLTQTGN